MYSRQHTKGSRSVTRPGDLDYTSKRGDKDHHVGGRDVKEKVAPFLRNRKATTRGTRTGKTAADLRKPRASTKGAMSKTRKGERDYTTKKTSKDFNRGGKRQTTRQGSTTATTPFKSMAHAHKTVASAMTYIKKNGK